MKASRSRKTRKIPYNHPLILYILCGPTELYDNYILLHSYYSHTSFYFELTGLYISNKVFIYVNTVGSRYLACNITTKLRLWHPTKSSSIIRGSCALWNMAVVHNPDSIGCTRFAAPACIVWNMCDKTLICEQMSLSLPNCSGMLGLIEFHLDICLDIASQVVRI